MTPERWQRLRAVFELARDEPVETRADLLASECGGDGWMRRKVEQMLAADETGGRKLGPGRIVSLDELAAAIEDVDADEPVPDVPRYRTLERIGAGGMGIVYLAERDDGAFDKRVALKLLRTGLDSRGFLRRFRAERQALARLEHPNIARLLDGGTAQDGRPFVAVEYVDGAPLDCWCDAQRLTIRRRVQLFRQVCAAVAHAHRSLVVHRDLKPANVLVTDDGVVKLLDFGIAKILDHGDASVTATQQRLLTPRYASPEQIAGEPIGVASDVYTLGVMLYELLTGRPAYELEDQTPRAYERAVREQTPLSPSVAITRPPGTGTGVSAARISSSRGADPATLQRTLRGDLDLILLRTLRKEPQRRYASVDHLDDDLARWLSGRPVSARPDTVGYRVGKFVSRHRWWVGGTSAAVLAVLGLTTTSLVLYAREQTAREQAEASLKEADHRRAVLAEVNRFFTEDILMAANPDRAEDRDITLVEALEAAEQRIEGRFAGAPLVEAAIRSAIGATYLELSRLAAAEPHCKRAWELRREHLGPDDHETLLALRDYANALFYQGELLDAAPIYEQLVETMMRTHGADDGYTHLALSQLAQVYEQIGRIDEAERMTRDLLETRLRVHGERHSSTLSTMNNLGSLLHRTGRTQEALSLFERTAALRREVNGENSPRTLIARGNLAAVYRNLGRPEDSLPIFEDVLARQHETIGLAHRNTLRTMSHLARTHLALADLAAAERVAREGLETALAEYGEGSPQADDLATALAEVLLAAGRAGEAEALLAPVHDRQRLALGEEHASVQATKALLDRARGGPAADDQG